MKILAAIDGSPCSDAVLNELILRSWPKDSKAKIITVAENAVPAAPDGFALDPDYLEQSDNFAVRMAQLLIDHAKEKMDSHPNSTIQISTDILRGSPREAILSQARDWDADLILVGSHGYHGIKRLWLGSVSQAVANHAKCSVEIVRTHEHADGRIEKVVGPVDDQC